MKRISYILLAVLVLAGCRTAKPTSASATNADSITVSEDSIYNVRHDSLSISEQKIILADEQVEFIKEGGRIYVSSAGSVILSGVAGVKYSGFRKSERMKTIDSLSLQSQSKDLVSAIHQSFAHSESQPSSSPGKWSWKVKCVVVVVLVMIIIILKITGIGRTNRASLLK